MTENQVSWVRLGFLMVFFAILAVGFKVTHYPPINCQYMVQIHPGVLHCSGKNSSIDQVFGK